MHYLEDGQWKESENIVEPFPDGAISRRGPNQAIFSPNLNAESVFDIQTPDKKRIRGGVRAILVTDFSTGRSHILGTVKDNAPGKLFPPNLVVYADAFDGLMADVVLEWRQQHFTHDVVLRERPKLPEGFDPQTSRLEIITEIVDSPIPEIKEQPLEIKSDKPIKPVPDHVLIKLDSLSMIMGKAFLTNNSDRWIATDPGSIPEGASSVLKQWLVADDGRDFLVESISWQDAEDDFKKLPEGDQANIGKAKLNHQITATRTWPESAEKLKKRHPVQIAQTAYEGGGFVLDFIVIPDQEFPTVFESGKTYLIQDSFYSGGHLSFQPGAVIKYSHDTYLLVYGSVSFPECGTPVIFTSKDDDAFGETITAIDGMVAEGSDGEPSDQMAYVSLWLYYSYYNSYIQNALFRWAQKGIQYDSNPGTLTAHMISNSKIESSLIGIENNLPDSDLVWIM